MSTEIEVRNPNADALTLNDVRQQVQLIQQVMHSVMQENEHYGVIPGTKGKPTLLKAGAEKLSHTFRLVPEYRIQTVDHEGGHREYIVTCRLIHATSGTFQGEGVGSCSTMEKKYRYRSEWKNNVKTTVENPDLADTYNTVLKMAKKRAHVDAILTATAASDIFTQDLEDMPREEAPAPKVNGQAKRKPSGDGAPGAPPQPAGNAPAKTWAQKIEAARAYLQTAENWDDARARTMARIAEWPEPHRRDVMATIEQIDAAMIADIDETVPVEFR